MDTELASTGGVRSGDASPGPEVVVLDKDQPPQFSGTADDMNALAHESEKGAHQVGLGLYAAVTKRWLSTGKLIGLALGVLAWIILWAIEFSDEYPYANDCAAVTALTGVWWVFEVWPLPITSLLPLIMFPFFQVLKGKTAASKYFNHISFLFVGAFLVDIAIEKVMLHKRAAISILLRFGIRPRMLMLGVMVVAGLISMVCSNTSTTIMLLPVVTGLLAGRTDGKNGKWYEKGLLLSIAYGATCGGLSTPIGTPPNGVLMGALENTFPDFPGVDFGTWVAFAFPISACMLLCAWGILCYIFTRDVEIDLDRNVLVEELSALGPMTRDEKLTAFALFLQVFFWVARPYIFKPYVGICSVDGYDDLDSCEGNGGKWSDYVDDGTVACMAAFLLFVFPSSVRPGEKILEEDDVAKLPWGLLILFGGGFTIAEGFKVSGLAAVVGDLLTTFVSFGAYGMVTMMTVVIVFMTEITSNTATASIIIPPVLGVAFENKINPWRTALPITIGASLAFMLPVATPPNAAVFATNKITMTEMMKAGFFLNLLGILIVPAFIFSSARVFGDLDEFPDWGATMAED